jgi:hypothetical protein
MGARESLEISKVMWVKKASKEAKVPKLKKGGPCCSIYSRGGKVIRQSEGVQHNVRLNASKQLFTRV